jgi:hypothetical protein
MFRRALLLALVPALAFLAGCSDDDDNPFQPVVTTTILSNVNASENTSISLDSGRVAAVGFTMPDSAYTLSYVRLKLVLDPGEADSVVVRLFTNAGGNPGSQILVFNDPVLPRETGDPELTTFVPASLYTLRADSTYWLVVHNENATAVQWTVGTPTVTPTGVATFVAAKVDALIAPLPPTTTVSIVPQLTVVGVEQ